jgi:hypothetical protein
VKIFSTATHNENANTRHVLVARRMRWFLKFFIAIPVLAAPFIFPKLSPILAPGGVIVLILLAIVGPKSERKWTWMTPEKRRASLDEPSTDSDPTKDDYYH